jgi:penicillin-binding protein 1A
VAVVSLLAVASWGLGGWLAWLTFDITRGLPSRATIAGIGNMVRATTLYDVRDRPVFAIFKEQRIEVPLARVSPHLVRAVLAVEDQRFYEHRGVDVVRVAAAVLANLRAVRAAQGGSTITQQLARQSFLTLEKSLRRKLRELVLAAQIERLYTKDQILELYVNKVYFGDGFHGAEAAALGFFGKHAWELDVAESALIAGLIKSPSAYAPTINLGRAVVRRAVVLQAMLEAGAIDRATYDTARAAPVVLENALKRDEAFGLYFKEQVRRELVERFGWDRVYQGGLRVYTTLDANMQHAAEAALEDALVRIEARPGYRHPKRQPAGTPSSPSRAGAAASYLQGAVVALDVATGQVRAMVGGRNFWESRFNRATQARRQPGSAFKPFVYAAALEGGFTPASLIQNLDDPVLTASGAWMPEDEHSDLGSMTLRTALRTSSNRAAVQLLQAVGIRRAVDYANRLHVGPVPAVPSLVLGAGEVTLISLTAAYASFADGGLVRRPILVRRVEDRDGRLLYRAEEQVSRAVEETTAFMMANMLADVVNAGTAYRARQEGFVLPAAGKTGTTNDFVDAWFIGFTPALAAGVWVGFDEPRTIVPNGFAGDLAVPLWAKFMKAATRTARPGWLRVPRGIVGVAICRLSGGLPSDGCGSVEVVGDDGEVRWRSYVATEYFVAGTEPQVPCEIHQRTPVLQQIADTGGLRPEPPPRIERPPDPIPRTETPGPEPTVGTAPAPPSPIKVEPPKKRSIWARIFGVGKKKK